MPERDRKDQGEGSPKQAGSGWFDPFNDWGGGGDVTMGGNGTKIAPTGDIFDHPPGQMR